MALEQQSRLFNKEIDFDEIWHSLQMSEYKSDVFHSVLMEASNANY